MQHLTSDFSTNRSTLRVAARVSPRPSSATPNIIIEQSHESLDALKNGMLSSRDAAKVLTAYYELATEIIHHDRYYDNSPLLRELLSLTPIQELTLRTTPSPERAFTGKNILETLEKKIFNSDTWPEKFHLLEDVAKKYNVTPKTINRWRSKGYLKFYHFEGLSRGSQRKLAISDYQIAEFETKHRKVIKRGATFTQVTPAEKEEIIARYTEIIDSEPLTPSLEILKRISREYSRSIETIKTLAEKNKLVEASKKKMDENIHLHMTSLYLKGRSLRYIAERFGVNEASAKKGIAKGLLLELENRNHHYVMHPEFKDPKNKRQLLGPMPKDDKITRGRGQEYGSHNLSYLRELYRYPVLTPKQEKHLFKKMNYQKYLSDQIYKREQKSKSPSPKALLTALKLSADAIATRNTLMEHNLRLVVSVVKNYVNDKNPLQELISDGNISLERAVENFDVTRRFRFSTYAVWAIRKNFAQQVSKKGRYHAHHKAASEELLNNVSENRINELIAAQRHQDLKERLNAALKTSERFDERELRVFSARYGFGEFDKEHTLKEVGEILHITKERVRQIQARAEDRLARLLLEDEEHIDLLDHISGPRPTFFDLE